MKGTVSLFCLDFWEAPSYFVHVSVAVTHFTLGLLVLLLFLYSHFNYPTINVSFILFVSKLAIIVISFVCGKLTK